MSFVTINGVTLHYQYMPSDGTPVVFLNSLGTDFRIWDDVIQQLGQTVPSLCIDKRGHGLSDGGPITMDLLVQDVIALMDHLNLSNSLICGVSVGGMIAQGLASSRPDLVSGLVLCCTGAKIGDAGLWNARIATVQSDGIASMSDAILDRWFSKNFRSKRPQDLAGYRNMLNRTSPDGYAEVCGAIRDCDFSKAVGGITVPTSAIAGADDLATPPALVSTLSRLIPNATFEMVPNCGHLPCIEAPDAIVNAIRQIRAKLP
jgi:3-oxoadipate enol-lactonase